MRWIGITRGVVPKLKHTIKYIVGLDNRRNIIVDIRKSKFSIFGIKHNIIWVGNTSDINNIPRKNNEYFTKSNDKPFIVLGRYEKKSLKSKFSRKK